ncbi:hypothetical protein AYO22_07262 [Fonsecaea multimorphosa]|nr:hypothetical protein AYO22_07262 [Fonsecaea multimorphosa]
MSIVLTQTSATQYVPKYLFVSGDCQRGTPKSRHVMKECKNPHLKLQLLPAETSLCQPVLRKRDSLRRQKQLAARSQSRVFPWLRREDIEQVPAPIDVSPPVDGGGSYDTLSDSSSRPSSPRQSQWTVGSTMGESHSSPPFTPPCSLLDTVEPTESSVNSSYNAQELVAYLHRSVICRLYDTEQSSNVNSPATIVVNHVIPRAVPARILLAISSLHRDIEVGHQTPSSVTLNLVLEGIGSLKEHLKSPSAVSDDTILAVINLWAYEVTLSIGSARRYSPVDIRMMAPNVGSNEVLRTSVESSYRPSRLFETLSKIQKHVSRRQFKPNILHEASFSALRTVLLRLDVMQYALHEQRTPMNRLRKSASLVSTLLFMFDVFLEVMDSAHGGAPPHKDQLVAIQKRFVDHRIDKEGSLEKVWQVLMTQQEAPQLQLHPRSWSIVEMVNAIKHLKISTVDALSRLLLGYLLPETCDYADDVFRCEKVLLQVYFELDGLADLT